MISKMMLNLFVCILDIFSNRKEALTLQSSTVVCLHYCKRCWNLLYLLCHILVLSHIILICLGDLKNAIAGVVADLVMFP